MLRYGRVWEMITMILLGSMWFSPVWSQGNGLERIHFKGKMTLPAVQMADSNCITPTEPWESKVDAAGRLTFHHYQASKWNSASSIHPPFSGVLAITPGAGGALIEAFIRLRPSGGREFLDSPEIRIMAEVGDIVVVRMPVSSIKNIAQNPAVLNIEISKEGRTTLNASRVEMGADKVHQGVELPRAYRGNGVIVGVIDSGIDFTHPDFSDDNGTRIQYLLEYTEGGGQNEWTKAQIDANPAAVTEKDGNGAHGHGTHVTGTAAGGGCFDMDFTGIAPESGIIFVKGIRNADSQGGFADADVVAGCQYIFQKAQQLGKPAAINLSLGGQFSPHDGSSLYEQTLSGLTGPGKIIVTSAGNEGDNPVHAGGTVIPDTNYVTFLYSTNPGFAGATLWHDPGIIDKVSVSAFSVQNSSLVFEAGTGWLPAGMQATGIEMKGENGVLGYIDIDAKTTQDPNNGDGNIVFFIYNNNQQSIDISKTLWLLVAKTKSAGRLDTWAVNAGFLTYPVGFNDAYEFPGNTEYTIGSPATALETICVGSYVTTNNWSDMDGISHYWINPDPLDPNNTVVPDLGQHSYFSSIGPTRDNRTAPDICAPGELIFAPLSSHLTEGIGYSREMVLQGGRYQGMQGTSMASPHITGLTALMLQADPTLDYQEVVQVLKETARTDDFTGTLPNNKFGWGKVDALEAVKAVAGNAGAIASVNLAQLEIKVPPDQTGNTHFRLSNLGQANLNYTISTTTQNPVSMPAASLRSPEMRMLQPLPAGIGLTARPRQQAAVLLPLSAPVSPGSNTAAPLSADGSDILINDDGNDIPDTFLGWGNGNNFDWINAFDCQGFNFELENFYFYMQTGSALTNMIYVYIYNGNRELITSGYVSLELASQGSWYDVGLNEPLSFEEGETFYIHLQTFYSMIDYPAGYDHSALLPDKSYYIDGNGDWINLNTTTDFANGAFLIRAAGTKNAVTPNQPPVAVAQLSKTDVQTGESITFDASGSYDTDGQIVRYSWSFGDGSSSDQATADHAYSQAGSFDWTLLVTDNNGATDETGGQVMVTQQPDNQPPVAIASVSATEALAGDTILFDASESYDTDGQVTQYAWDFGDGNSSSQAAASHIFAAEGAFTYILTVTDDKGATSQASGLITISAKPSRLTCTPANGIIAPGNAREIQVFFDASGLAEGTYNGEIHITGNGGEITLPVQILVDANVKISPEGTAQSVHYELSQNYPNPFNPETVICYRLAASSSVTLSVFDITGQRVRLLDSGTKPAGSYRFRWDGNNQAGHRVSSGVYIYRLEVLNRESQQPYVFTKKMILLK